MCNHYNPPQVWAVIGYLGGIISNFPNKILSLFFCMVVCMVALNAHEDNVETLPHIFLPFVFKEVMDFLYRVFWIDAVILD